MDRQTVAAALMGLDPVDASGIRVASEHHATLAELCRQQHEAVTALLQNDVWRLIPIRIRIKLLRPWELWPDDPTEEVEG